MPKIKCCEQIEVSGREFALKGFARAGALMPPSPAFAPATAPTPSDAEIEAIIRRLSYPAFPSMPALDGVVYDASHPQKLAGRTLTKRCMAIPTIKSTYTLDLGSVRALEALAQQWQVSKSEVLRRAIRMAASIAYPNKTGPLQALDRLQSSVMRQLAAELDPAATAGAQ